MQRFKPGQVYYNPFTKNTLLIVDYPKVRRISSGRGRPPREMEISDRTAKKLVLIGNNFNSIQRVDVTTMSDTDPRYAVVKTKPEPFKADRAPIMSSVQREIDTAAIKRRDRRLAELTPAPYTGRNDDEWATDVDKRGDEEDAPWEVEEQATTVPPKPLREAYREALTTISSTEKQLITLRKSYHNYRVRKSAELERQQDQVIELADILHRVLEDDATDDQIRDVLGRLPVEIQALFAKK